MAGWQYTKGLHDLGNGCWAYLLPDGSWGWSNAGLVVDGDQTLLVDTLFDLKLTREMLDTMVDAVPAARAIGTLVNTHANGDHTHGNQLVTGAEIVGTQPMIDEMHDFPPEMLSRLFANWEDMGEAGAFLHETMGRQFDFEGIVHTPPTKTFDKTLSISVGDKEVRLVDFGPAHTQSDVVAFVPADKTLFTGDLLFSGGHPAVWAGPVSNWIQACDTMLGWDIETIIPGHGPITDKSALRDLKDYFLFLTAEARRHFEAGHSVDEASRAILSKPFLNWIDDVRVFINVNTLYREFAGEAEYMDLSQNDALRVWDMMGRFHRERLEGLISPCPAHPHNH